LLLKRCCCAACISWGVKRRILCAKSDGNSTDRSRRATRLQRFLRWFQQYQYHEREKKKELLGFACVFCYSSAALWVAVGQNVSVLIRPPLPVPVRTNIDLSEWLWRCGWVGSMCSTRRRLGPNSMGTPFGMSKPCCSCLWIWTERQLEACFVGAGEMYVCT